MNRIAADELSEVVPVWGVHSFLPKRAHAWKRSYGVYDGAGMVMDSLCGQREFHNECYGIEQPGDTPRCKRCERAVKAKAHT